MKKSLFVGVLWLGLLLTCSSVSAQLSPVRGDEGAAISDRGGPVPVTGQVARYVFPNFTSVTGSGSRSATTITVYNQTTKPCTVNLQFQKGQMSTTACSITTTIQPGWNGYFCSRSIGAAIGFCDVTCDPALTLDIGRVYVLSNSACTNIVVDGQTVFMSDASDTLVTGVRQLSVVKINKATAGD